MFDDEPFVLTNEPQRSKLRFENDDRRQTTLFAGMDCLPGQEFIFDTDGVPEDGVEPGITFPFTDETRDRVVASWLDHFPQRSLDDLNCYGGVLNDEFWYEGRAASLHVKYVDSKPIDVHMSWEEFKRRARRLAEQTLF